MQTTEQKDYKNLYEQSEQKVAQLEMELHDALHQMMKYKKMLFGNKSERYVSSNEAQLSLEMKVDALGEVVVEQEKKISYTRQKRVLKLDDTSKRGRMFLPEHLRRREISIQPDGDLTGYRKIADVITEILQYKPGEFFVDRIVRAKYIDDQGNFLIGELPKRGMHKSIIGSSLASYIVVEKHLYHMPLHRTRQKLSRAGIDVSDSTMSDWANDPLEALMPLLPALKQEMMTSFCIEADETSVKVLYNNKRIAEKLKTEKLSKGKHKKHKRNVHTGWFWIYQDSVRKIVYFDYRHTRGREGPGEFLKDYKGRLMCDGLEAYELVAEQSGEITLGNCLIHSRRYFLDALYFAPKECDEILCLFSRLYKVEDRCKELGYNASQIKAVRRRESKPILKQLHKCITKAKLESKFAKSPFMLAINYTLKRWKQLTQFLADGRLRLDNNAAENSLRAITLGRKNYLFCGSEEAAQRNALAYSLIAMCKMRNIDPYLYFENVLDRIDYTPKNEYINLLPHKWEYKAL